MDIRSISGNMVLYTHQQHKNVHKVAEQGQAKEKEKKKKKKKKKKARVT